MPTWEKVEVLNPTFFQDLPAGASFDADNDIILPQSGSVLLTFRNPVNNYAGIEITVIGMGADVVGSINVLTDSQAPLGPRGWIDTAFFPQEGTFVHKFPYFGEIEAIAISLLGAPAGSFAKIKSIKFVRKADDIVKIVNLAKASTTPGAGWVNDPAAGSWTKVLTGNTTIPVTYSLNADEYCYCRLDLGAFSLFQSFATDYQHNLINFTTGVVEFYFDITDISPKNITFNILPANAATVTVTVLYASKKQNISAFGNITQVAAPSGIGANQVLLGSAAYANIGDFLQSLNNLSDLSSAAVARTNLQLGDFATRNVAGAVLAGITSITAANIQVTTGLTFLTVGNVSRTLVSRFGDYLSVKDFGVIGNGVADDTLALQTAIDSFGAGAGVLFWPAGTYKISAALNIAHSISMIGAGEYVTFIQTTSATVPIFNVTGAGYLEITGLTFAASVVRTAGYFVDINDPAVINVYISNCYFSAYFGGIRWAGASVLDINQCQFINGTAATGTGINIAGGADVAIRHCLWSAAAQTAAGILVTSCGDLTLVDLNITKAGVCLYLNPPNGKVIPSVEATSCFFDTSNIGLFVDGAGTGTVTRCRFVSCWFSSHVLRGALINSAAGVTDGLAFVGCEFYGNAVSGLDLFAGAASKNILIDACIFAGNTVGINVGGGSNFVTLTNSHIAPYAGFGLNGTGISFNGAYNHWVISNNKITGNTNNVIPGAPGAQVLFLGNDGYITAAKGTATVVSGTTTIVVNHGLSVTPVVGDIQLTPTTPLGAAANWWVNTITATQFTINVNVNPTVNVTFGWQVRSLNYSA